MAREDSSLSAAEKALQLITEVRPREVTTALLLSLNVFLLLTAYYVIKPVREGLILELESGAEYKSAMSAASAVALLLLVPAYSRFAATVSRGRLVVGVTLFFVSHLVLFYLGSRFDVVRANLGLVFYLWVGIFNMMLVAQFWAFANDIYTEEQGKRLFPLIGIGASVGAAVGSRIAETLAVPIGRYQLMIVSAGLLLACALLFRIVNTREVAADSAEAAHAQRATSVPEASEHTRGAFGLVFKHRYLRLLAAFSVIFTLVNTNGEYILSKLFKAAATAAVDQGRLAHGSEGDFIAAAYGGFYFYVNVAGVLIQAFLVSRVVKHGGLKIAFYILPMIALVGGLAFALVPMLSVMRVSKIAENATDYSLNNTVRNMLWLPTTREMKYRAKQAVDTFFVRIGDVGSLVCVMIGVGWLDLELRSLAIVNTCIVVFWLLLAAAIVRENARLGGDRQTLTARLTAS
jgi:AAA family ATP:ADP antiporter